MMEAVQQNGLALQYASSAMQDRHDVVLTAVRQNGMALQYASESRRSDFSVVWEAVLQNSAALDFAQQPLEGHGAGFNGHVLLLRD